MDMIEKIRIHKNLKTPIYQQIVDAVISGVENDEIEENNKLPSINQIATEYKLARETVVKSFKILQEKGIIKAVRGKGFFVASIDIKTTHRVFVLFDTLSAYKEVMFQAIKNGFGSDAFIDIYFHHFNSKVFERLINDAAGNYSAYIIIPFDNPKIEDFLKPIPKEKLFLIDRSSRFYRREYVGVYQDFEGDVYKMLESVNTKTAKYKQLNLVFRNTNTELPVELRIGFEAYCNDYAIKHSVTEEVLNSTKLEKGVAYIVIDDDDLVCIVEKAKEQNMKIGEDVGIISYNDTPLKKVVAEGISVITTDFALMGSRVAEMVLNGEKICVKNPSKFIDRKSF